jgi:hypothetical protein
LPKNSSEYPGKNTANGGVCFFLKIFSQRTIPKNRNVSSEQIKKKAAQLGSFKTSLEVVLINTN